MPVVNIEPTKEHPVPYDTSDAPVPTLLEELAVAGNTAELQEALRGKVNLTLDPADAAKQATLLREVIEKRQTQHLKTPAVALGAASFIREYGQSLAFDAAATRAAITTKLMEIANCGDPKHELRALELLGKHSDIGLFTERSEITINYKTPEALEDAIKERVKRLLNADIIDVTPLGMNLDEELGVVEAKAKPKSLAEMLDDEEEEEEEGESK
jgi:hypothetical protein